MKLETLDAIIRTKIFCYNKNIRIMLGKPKKSLVSILA